MPKNTYRYYDQDTASFVDVRPGRRLHVAVAVAVALALAGLLSWGMDAATATSEELALQAENEALRQQLAAAQTRMGEFAARLDHFSETDQALYRALLEADPIPEQVRRVGVGGADPYGGFDGFSEGSAALLRQTSEALDELERRVGLQNASYRELTQLARKRERYLAQLPALLPVDGPVVSGYGMRRHPILRVKKMHAGIDLLVRTGTPVYAPADGVVKEIGRGRVSGRYLKIEHPETGYTTVYAHLSEVADHLRRGRAVKRGEQVALSGNTGRSTGPHLHYGILDGEGRSVNPVHFFAPSMTPRQYQALLEASERSAVSLD